MMRARFQRDISRCTTRQMGCLLQRMHFGMRRAGALMPAFTDYLTTARDDTADARIGAGTKKPQLGQPQGLSHMTMIIGGKHGVCYFFLVISFWLL